MQRFRGQVAAALALTLCSCTAAARRSPASSDRAAGQQPSPTRATTPAAPSPTPSPRDTAFTGTVSPIDARMRASMVSWHDRCPVPIEDLRLLSLSYWGFDGRSHQGRMIVNTDVARTVVRVFRSLFADRFPIHRMEPIDAYGGDDERSMAADNTSGFNCRTVAGSTSWSQHAYGRAIDVNPLENPEVDGYTVDPPQGAPYADRSKDATGMIHPGDAVVRAFSSVGWGWGGTWRSFKDWQHFSANGRCGPAPGPAEGLRSRRPSGPGLPAVRRRVVRPG
jgi:D-alanyl-D-alanine carboxypeptidase